MATNKFDVYNFLKKLSESMYGISDTIFTSERPKSAPDRMKDFVVVSFPVMLYDKGAYGSTYCRIELYARDSDDGFENLNLLNEMKNKAMSAFPVNNDIFKAVSPRLLMSGSDGYGFHCWIIQATVFIK